MLTLAGDVKKPYRKSYKRQLPGRNASEKGRVARDGVDHYYLSHFAGKDKVRKPNMQSDRADRVHGIF